MDAARNRTRSFRDGELTGRLIGATGGGDIVVSTTVKDLVAGSALTFADCGEHELKGVPGSWRLFTVEG
jgi:class 3 adenylate cyclase